MLLTFKSIFIDKREPFVYLSYWLLKH